MAKESLTFHNLAGLIATRAMLAGEDPLVDAPLGATWAFDTRHLVSQSLADKKRRQNGYEVRTGSPCT